MDGTSLRSLVAYQTASGIDVAPLQFSGDFLELAVVFFIIAIVAAVFGARGIAGISMAAAKWLVIVFIVLAIVSALL